LTLELSLNKNLSLRLKGPKLERNKKVKFFKIVANAPNFDFASTLASISALQMLERNRLIRDQVISARLDQFEIVAASGVRVGDFLRGQTEGLPSAPTETNVAPLPVERIGHHLAFAFDPPTNVIAVESNTKFSNAMLLEYLNCFTLGIQIGFETVLTRDAIDQITNQNAKSLKVRFARLQTIPEHAHATSTLLDNVLWQRNALNANTMTLELKPPTGENLLGILDMIRRLLTDNANYGCITSLKVGTDETSGALDLFGQALTYETTLELSNDPNANYSTRRALVLQALNEHTEYIREFYGQAANSDE
jgi:hypothetical protein